MPKGKGASGATQRTLAAKSMDVGEEFTDANTSTQSTSNLRGAARSSAGDPIDKVTITMPSSMIRSLDAVVYERKQTTRAYNRSALIQEAVEAFLKRGNDRD